MNSLTRKSIPVLLGLTLAPLYSCFALSASAEQPQTNMVLGASGLPLPRFVSLGTTRIFVRTGPGKQYPIDWVYLRKNLPVEVIAEYDIWRRIKDHDGSTGWVHGSMLSGRRTVTIKDGTQTLYHKPDLQSWPVLHAQQDVIAELRRCQPSWCEVQIEGKKGWISMTGIWGVGKADIKK